ncbi:DNA polymerase-3 subunit delta [Altererythrobacter atlanticus]|uniref:DNA-directed DNA polymerase n=1 Tax=Croceibacterium atlanticum TaxID=1267766 RepID=A0A0F7KVA8_9SPHN|nr:DNA polymerase III subunit delta [Croceibacterium atlanticum]AKH43167.1 DNA polymerase III subunit delta [Croceibacterium atlanticum]MBB5732128.1 DNA polymerase-3 subunit delta [Croceibacterium atlanticum]
MKATQRDFGNVAPKAAKQARVAFFCGPDEAGASSAAAKLIGLLPDAGERIEFSGSELRSDPVKLGDEARSTSLFGGTRHIYVRATGDEAHDAVKTYLEAVDFGQADGACPVVIVATNATDKSRTAKLLEKRADGLVAMFYPPDLRSVTDEVRRMAGAAGLTLGGDIAEQIARASGLDVRLAQSEVTKLALYLDASPQAPRKADAEALAAIGAKTEEDGFMPLVNAVLSGQVNRLQGELQRFAEVSLNPVGVLLALERRAAQLAQLTARLGQNGNINALLDAEQKAHRVFWRDKRDLTEQLGRWNARKLDRLVHRLAATHRALLGNSQSAELLLAQELVEITRFAAARR